MPAGYISLHLGLGFLLGWIATRVPPRRMLLLGLAALILVVAGYALERSPDLAWGTMALGLRDLVFYCNVSFEGVCVLLVLMLRSISQGTEGKARKAAAYRAGFLSLPLLGGALWSYSWMFAPLPQPLSGTVNETGYMEQTTDDSCSAAAAAMLLYHYGIKVNEAEMAKVCLTRAGAGTPPAGLYRGLCIEGARKGLHPVLVNLKPSEFHNLGGPAIIAVGLRRGTPEKIAARLAEYGWRPGIRHAVTVYGGDKDGKWLDVADPTFGQERWPVGDMEYIWDDRALVLRK